MKRHPQTQDPIRDGRNLEDICRNERQKSVFLCEEGRLRREELDKLISDSKGLVRSSKMLVEESKKLCDAAGWPPKPRKRSS